MYSSLHKIDIVVDQPEGKLAVQTDHREQAELEEELDLSVIFALTRIINPMRMDYAGVRMVFLGSPPPSILDLVAWAGAEAELTAKDQNLPPRPDAERVDRVAREALDRLGQWVLADLGVSADEAGLRAVEREYAARVASFGDRKEDEIGYWTSVVHLGAATGAVLGALQGGQWVRDPQFFGLIPFMWSHGERLSNVFDKVERFFSEGESESPTVLLRLAADSHVEPGKVMFNLRPPDWGARDQAWFRPLMETGEGLEGDDVPLVALVRDMPNSVATMAKDLDGAEVEELEARALANIAAVAVQVEEMDVGFPMLVVHGDYYAAEKLLVPDFMAELHARMDSELLAAGVPVKGTLFVTSAVQDPKAIAGFAAAVEGQHRRAPANERLSTEVFLISEGRVVGVARAGGPDAPAPDAEAKPKKKGFFAKLFGWD